MAAVYNEIEPFAAAMLRNLIAAGLIAPGDVDERSIEDVTPDDYRRYAQVHLFAGIGLWSLSARRAGIADDDEFWSASCPCQPFSAAGKGGGFADERHLWPAAFHLIDVRRPKRVVGEQVASPDGLAWFDAVHADLEGAGYTAGAVDLCVASVGAPGQRQRLYWVADASMSRHPLRRAGADHPGQRGREFESERLRSLGRLADTYDALGWPGSPAGDQRDRQDLGWPQGSGDTQGCGGNSSVAHPNGQGRGVQPERNGWTPRGGEIQSGSDLDGRSYNVGLADSSSAAGQWNARSLSRTQETIGSQDRSVNEIPIDRPGDGGAVERPGPVNGFWRDADWLSCTDGKWRPVEPGTRPLATGYPSRVGLLRAIGNAINPEVAEAFLRCLP